MQLTIFLILYHTYLLYAANDLLIVLLAYILLQIYMLYILMLDCD